MTFQKSSTDRHRVYVHKFIKVNIFSVQITKTLQPTLSCWGVVKLARSGLSASISDHGQAKISVCTLQILQISVANPESYACWTLDKHSWGSFIGMFLYLLSGYLYSLPVACVEEMTSSLTNEAMTHILLHAVLMAGFDKTFYRNNQNKC